MRLRSVLLAGGLVAAALVAVFGDRSAPGELVAAARSAPAPASGHILAAAQATTAGVSDHVDPDANGVLLLRERVVPSIRKQNATPFAVTSWAPPPPTSSVEQKPAAPPLPFKYLGKELEDDRWTVFLAREDEVLIVRESDVIRDTYRIEKIAPPTVTILYLPLNETQQLTIQ